MNINHSENNSLKFIKKLNPLRKINEFNLLGIHNYDEMWWIEVLGICWNYEDTGCLFYLENDMGHWKFDLFWIRPFYYRWKEWRDYK